MNINPKREVTVEEMEVKIAEFLLNNPNPRDLAFHAFAAGIGVEKETLEEVSYRMLATVLSCARDWNLLTQDPALMHNAMYMVGCDPEQVVTQILVGNPNLSPNMLELVLRLRNTDALNRIFDERGRTLSSTSGDFSLDSELEQKPGDIVHVTDPTRIDTVTENLEALGMSQDSVDTVLRLLEMDRFTSEANLLNASYNSMRESLVASTKFAFDDPIFQELKRKFAGLSGDRRDLGNQIRVAKVRAACRLMRSITSTYGISNRGAYSNS